MPPCETGKQLFDTRIQGAAHFIDDARVFDFCQVDKRLNLCLGQSGERLADANIVSLSSDLANVFVLDSAVLDA